MKTVDFPLGVATSIGSLPHRTACEAIDFVLDRQPELPAAPSLPAHRPMESMVAQGAWGVPGVEVDMAGTLRVPDPLALDPQAPLDDPGLDDPPYATMRAFLRAVADRPGPIKLQLIGPLTLGLALVDAGVPVDLAFRVSEHAVRERAVQVLALVDAEAPLAEPTFMLDEPGLVGGLRPDVPLDADDTIDIVSSVLAVIEPNAITGIHVCGAADWRVVIQTGAQVISVPVGAALAESAGTFGGFLERGGWVAWGAVPTDGPVGETPARLWRTLSSQWCELVQEGCDPVLLRRQALVTPVCGLALHGEAQAAHALDLTRQIAERLHDQVVGVRLSVGA